MEKQALLQEIQKELQYYLGLGSKPELANSLDKVPENHQEAIYNMVCDHQYKKTQKTMIAFHVTEDVRAIVSGNAEGAEFSKPYLEALQDE